MTAADASAFAADRPAAFTAKAAFVPPAALSLTMRLDIEQHLCGVSAAAHLQQAGDLSPLWLLRSCFRACSATTCAGMSSVCMVEMVQRDGGRCILGVVAPVAGTAGGSTVLEVR